MKRALKIERAYTSETSATLPTTAWCNKPRRELTSIIKHCEILRSVINTSIGLESRSCSRNMNCLWFKPQAPMKFTSITTSLSCGSYIKQGFRIYSSEEYNTTIFPY
jgi:hypothetical protein